MGGDVAAKRVKFEGIENLRAAFKELGDMKSAEWKSTLRASVTRPAKLVIKQAQQNITRLSPGKAIGHMTYKGNWVGSGFALRSIGMKVKVYPRQGRAAAFIGVAKEAFYAISFFELGVPSRGIPRQTWLTPALLGSQDSAVRECGLAMFKRIAAISRKRAKVAAKAIKGPGQ